MTDEQKNALESAIAHCEKNGYWEAAPLKELLAAGASEGQAEPVGWAIREKHFPDRLLFSHETGEKPEQDDREWAAKQGHEYVPLYTHPSAELTDLREERDDLLKHLADCRDAMPVPEPDSEADRLWGGAVGNPGDVPFFVRASITALRERIAGMGKDAGDAIYALRVTREEIKRAITSPMHTNRTEVSLRALNRWQDAIDAAIAKQDAKEPPPCE